ncbi:MAG: hypothetical protein QM534_10880 [Sediminibacterium sp.]|nr:hypothetical protein [Sediminibacterium sp.]
MNNDTKNWMMRAGGSYLIEAFISNNTVSIGWNNLGPLYAIASYKELIPNICIK